MDRLAVRVTGVAAVLAPLLMLASTIAHIAGNDELNSGETGGIIQVWATIALGVAIVGLARLLEGSTPRGAVVVVVLGVGAVAAAAGYGIDAIHADVHDVDSLQDVSSSPAAPIALQLPGLMHTVGLVTLGVLLARHRLVPAVAAYSIALGAVLFLAARIPDIEELALVGDAVLLVGFGGAGITLLRGRAAAPA